MAFSLSPSVDVREFDLSLSIPNLPSAKTGMVIRADQGEALTIKSITSERELVEEFGKPTAYNYMDWFNAWNFLQYSSSLYLVRAIDPLVENSGVGIEVAPGTNYTVLQANQMTQGDMFNSDKAELTLDTLPVTENTILFFNKEVTSQKKYAVSICMDEEFWAAPFTADGAHSFVFQYGGTYSNAAVLIESVTQTVTTVPCMYNTMVAGDTFVYGGDTYIVYAATGSEVQVYSESAVFSDILDTWTSSDAVERVYAEITDDVVAARNAKFADEIIAADGSFANFSSFFEYPPEFNKGEFAVIVFMKDEDGLYTAEETFVVSKYEGARDSEGRNIFAPEVFFKSSKLLYCAVPDPNETLLEGLNTGDQELMEVIGDDVTDLVNEPADIYPVKALTTKWAYDAAGYAQKDVQAAYDLFDDPETFDINLLVSHQLDMNISSTICSQRKDCMAIVAPYDYASIVGKTSSEASQWMIAQFGSQTAPVAETFNAFNSYSAIYGNMKYQYDKFNDVNRWMCIAGDVAGLAAQTDANRDPWWAFAGLERGKILNSIKPAFNPNKQNRDDLYINSINPVMSVPGEGVMILWGQKTSLAKPSAFDRVNVRRLLITVEKAISTASRYALFEFNDDFTRARLRSMIEPFLRDVKGRRGIYDFLVVIDSSNNTAEVIDKNALVIDIYIKPTKVAEFIQINMNVTRTDANFEELIAR